MYESYGYSHNVRRAQSRTRICIMWQLGSNDLSSPDHIMTRHHNKYTHTHMDTIFARTTFIDVLRGKRHVTARPSAFRKILRRCSAYTTSQLQNYPGHRGNRSFYTPRPRIMSDKCEITAAAACISLQLYVLARWRRSSQISCKVHDEKIRFR